MMDEFSCYDDEFRADFVTVVSEYVGSHPKVADADSSLEVESMSDEELTRSTRKWEIEWNGRRVVDLPPSAHRLLFESRSERSPYES